MAIMIRRNFWYLLLIFGIFFIDRVSKNYFIESERFFGDINLIISPFLNLHLIWNDGIAFGLFSFEQKTYYHSLTGVIILITIIVLWMITRTEKTEKFAFSMIFGGSLGNIFDRVYYQSVPDFIDFHINNFHWFIFNVADIFITIGVILLISLEIFKKEKA